MALLSQSTVLNKLVEEMVKMDMVKESHWRIFPIATSSPISNNSL